MALIVEDGTGVPGANTYVSRAAFIVYAADRGITIANDANADALLYKAMDYLLLFEGRWKGVRTSSTQSLAWARKQVYLDNVLFPDNEIPAQLVRAQAELGLQVQSGINLLPTLSGQTAFVTREKVDVIETEYSEAIA